MNFSLFIAFFLFQVPEYDVKLYDSKSGLPNNIVYDIHQDSDGFIWLATENGLSRFDAYDFKTFHRNSENPKSLPSNVVRSVFEDQQRNLWVSTINGLAKYDSDQNLFKRFSIPDSLSPANQDIQQVIIDEFGAFWFVNYDLYRFEPSTGTFKKFDVSKKAYALGIVDNKFSVLSDKPESCSHIDVKELKLQQCRSDFEITFEGVFATPSSNLSLTEYLIPNRNISQNAMNIAGIPDHIKPSRFYKSKNGVRWLGSEKGLYIKTENTYQQFDFSVHSNSLTENIKSIFEDNAGGIWIGTTGGLFHLDTYVKPFQRLNINGDHNMVMALKETQDGIIINQFGKSTIEIPAGNSESMNAQLFGEDLPDQIWDIYENPNSNFKYWLATNDGLIFYDRLNGKFEKAEFPERSKEFPMIFCLLKDDNDQIWAGGIGAVFRFSLQTGVLNKEIYFTKELPGGAVQDIIEWNDNLLVATENRGLFLVDKNEKIKSVKNTEGFSFWDIYKSDSGEIWLVGSGGLFKFDQQNVRVELINNFNSSIIFSITGSTDNFLWMGSDKGLIQYSPINDNFKQFLPGENGSPVEFNRRSILSSKKGKIYAGSMEGVFHFDPLLINKNQTIPPVRVTDFRIITSDSVSQIPVEQIDQRKLKWEENTFEIDFTALNFTNPKQNQYRYQLVGHDPEVREAKDLRTARYVRVPEGEYIFQVFGSNNDGVWNPEPATFQIEITPPFWRTTWFRLFALLLLGFLIWQLYRFRVRQLLEVERVRLRIASDLHDEIGSGLSGIALTGDLLRNQAKTGNTKPEMIEKITTNARSLASSLDSIVWLIDSGKETLGDLVMKTRRMAKEMLHGIQIEFSEELSEKDFSIELNTDTKRHLFLLVKEALNNIAKHAEAKKVIVCFKKDESLLTVQISDNGTGFDHSEIEKGNGLENMRNRANQLGADYSLNTGKQGTEITIKKKLP